MAILAVSPGVPARTLAEFTGDAKASPAPVDCGSAGHAWSSHYFGEVYARAAGITMSHVPYKGESALAEARRRTPQPRVRQGVAADRGA